MNLTLILLRSDVDLATVKFSLVLGVTRWPLLLNKIIDTQIQKYKRVQIQKYKVAQALNQKKILKYQN